MVMAFMALIFSSAFEVFLLSKSIGANPDDRLFIATVLWVLMAMLCWELWVSQLHLTAFRDEAGRDHLHREGPTWADGRWFFFAGKADKAPLLEAKGMFVRFRIAGLLYRRGQVYYPSYIATCDALKGKGWSVIRAWNWRVTLRDPNGVEFGGLDWHGLLAQLNDYRSYEQMTVKIRGAAASEASIRKAHEIVLQVYVEKFDKARDQRDHLGRCIMAALGLMTELRASLGASGHAKWLGMFLNDHALGSMNGESFEGNDLSAQQMVWVEMATHDTVLQRWMVQRREWEATERNRRAAKKRRGAAPA